MKLMELDHAIVKRLDAPFLSGDGGANYEDLVSEFERDLDLSQLEISVREAMSKFDRSKSAQSDAWLGPRVHAALRLTRREASRRGMWNYLAVVAVPEYVRWRWGIAEEDGDSSPPLERFVGPDYKHAIARLWWMAELFRNGQDYEPARRALNNQDITNNLFRMDIAHHRPTAQGAVSVLSGSNGHGEDATGREANALAKAANAAATTLAIDALAVDDPMDESARERWIEEADQYDASKFFDTLPAGPDDPRVPEVSVTSMEVLLVDLLAEAPVRGRAQ